MSAPGQRRSLPPPKVIRSRKAIPDKAREFAALEVACSGVVPSWGQRSRGVRASASLLVLSRLASALRSGATRFSASWTWPRISARRFRRAEWHDLIFPKGGRLAVKTLVAP